MVPPLLPSLPPFFNPSPSQVAGVVFVVDAADFSAAAVRGAAEYVGKEGERGGREGGRVKVVLNGV